MSSIIRCFGVSLLFVALAGSAGCNEKRRDRMVESIPWDQVIDGLTAPTDSPEYLAAVVSLSRTWAEHGEEGSTLWFEHGLRYAGLGANGAVGGLAETFGVPPEIPDDKVVAAAISSLTGVAKTRSDEEFRFLVLLSDAYGSSGSKPLQPIVEIADQGATSLAGNLRLCLAPVLVAALIDAAGAVPGDRGRVLLEKIPGWPSPPTRDITQTLFPANLSRLSRWISDGRAAGGLEAKAWENIAARVDKGLGDRMYDLPVVVSDDPRPGTPVSGIVGRFTPLEVATVVADGVKFGVRPVVAWQDTFMELVSGRATWTSPHDDAEGEPADISIGTLAARAAAMRDLAARLEKGVYPTLIGTAMGERTGKSVLVVVAADATADMLVSAVKVLSVAGYSDFRLVPAGAPGSVNPFMENRDTGSLARARTARVFLTPAGASIFPNPGGEIIVDFMPAGVEPIPSTKRVNGLFVAWNAARGFSASLAQAFSTLGLSAAGRVELAEIVVAGAGVPGTMVVDAICELQASPGVQFPTFEPYFPGLVCPQGRSCPGVVPVLGTDFPAPASVR